MNDEHMKCICCNKKKLYLIMIDKSVDSIFLHRRGVCQNCLKNRDIEQICKEFEIREARQRFEEAKDRYELFKKELENLENTNAQ